MMGRFPSGLWAAVLVVSVLLNGVILGAIAAGAAAGLRPAPDGGGPVPASLSMRMLSEGLPPEAREDMRRIAIQEARQTRGLVRDMREANMEAMQALGAEEFDADAALAAFAEVRAARAALEERAHETTVTLFGELPPDTRQTLLERAGRDFGRGRFGGGSPGGPRDGFPDGSRDGPPPGGPPPPGFPPDR